MYNLTLEIVRLFFVGMLPLLGAVAVASIISGLFQGLTRIQEPAIGHIFRFTACILCVYWMGPSLSEAMLSLMQEVLRGRY